LRRRNILGLLALAVLAALTVVSQADALTGLKTYKEVVINIQVTPSPAPVGWLAPKKSSYPAALPPPLQIASSGAAWDVAPGAPVMIAQVSAQPTPVPVQFVAKPDPNAAYLKVLKEEIPMFANDGRTPADGAQKEWRVLSEFNPKYKSVKVEQTYSNRFVDEALKKEGAR